MYPLFRSKQERNKGRDLETAFENPSIWFLSNTIVYQCKWKSWTSYLPGLQGYPEVFVEEKEEEGGLNEYVSTWFQKLFKSFIQTNIQVDR